RGLIARELAPEALLRRLVHTGAAAGELGLELPERLRHLLRATEAGQLTIHLHADDLEAFGQSAARVGNRIVLALLASALIDGAATLATRQRRSTRRRWIA